MSMNIIDEFTPLFAPKTVAVIGASTKGNALPNVFIRRIREKRLMCSPGLNGDDGGGGGAANQNDSLAAPP